MRPLFPYYGSKWNIARHYPPPVHRSVVEPFAGSAGYSLFYNVRRAVLVEADPVVAGVWSYLIGASEAEILALPEISEVGDSVDNYPLIQEARWLIGFWLNRGSATPKKSRTAYSARTDRKQLIWSSAARERVAAGLHGIREWSVVNADFTVAPDIEATWFVDPPYGDKGRFYRKTFSRFPELGAWCLRRSGQVVACEGPGADWLPFRPVGSFKSTKGRAEEYVWLSPVGAAVAPKAREGELSEQQP